MEFESNFRWNENDSLEKRRLDLINFVSRRIISKTPVLLNDLQWQPTVVELLNQLAATFVAEWREQCKREAKSATFPTANQISEYVTNFLTTGKNLDYLLGFELAMVDPLYTLDHSLVFQLKLTLMSFLVHIFHIDVDTSN